MITDERKAHIFGVACLMKEYAIKLNLSTKEVEDYFLVGLLHDIGYEFLEERGYPNHGNVGGLILKRQGFKFWKEIYYHGEVNCKYQSRLLDVLNCADMHIDYKGRRVSFDERLKDISIRYNKPICELKEKQLVDELILKGYK